jgi:hypothetical protein
MSSKLNILAAWPYIEKRYIANLTSIVADDGRFLLDSGAFTAWKAGTVLKLVDYLRFIDSLPVKPWRHFMLDVIGDPIATRKNYEEAMRLGYRPIPIFTRGEDPAVLDFYYASSDLVAVGGLVGTRGNKGFVNGIMRRIKGRQVHWLGFTQSDFLGHYRPYSADSSSVNAGYRYGQLKLYAGQGKWISAHRTDFVAGRPSPAMLTLLQRYQITPMELADRRNWANPVNGSSSTIQLASFRSHARYQHDVECQLGTKLFFAFGGHWYLPLIAEARRWCITHGLIPSPTAQRSAA